MPARTIGDVVVKHQAVQVGSKYKLFNLEQPQTDIFSQIWKGKRTLTDDDNGGGSAAMEAESGDGGSGGGGASSSNDKDSKTKKKTSALPLPNQATHLHQVRL